MPYYNIFQGNSLVKEAIKEGLKLPNNSIDDIYDNQYINEFYFQAFFYLTKRFGMPKIYDDYKDAGVWPFSVKGFKIQIHNCSKCDYTIMESDWKEVENENN